MLKNTVPFPCASQRLMVKFLQPMPLERPDASLLGQSIDQPPSIPLKIYCPEAVTKSVTQWVEDSDTSASSSGRSSEIRLVEDPFYREENLAANNIYLRPSSEQYPEHIASLVNKVRRDRDSPGPSLDQVRQDVELEALALGAVASDVKNHFRNNIFTASALVDSVREIGNFQMAKCVVPQARSKLKVGVPAPDILYGYQRGAFPQQHQTQLTSMGVKIVANTRDLIYPFFLIEFKGDGPSGSGSLWVATNQCLGGAASCVNIAEYHNHQLMQCRSDKVLPINSATFSVAMSGTEARLYISWKHEESYYMRNIKSFLLQDPIHYLEFRKYVLNIIDWGKDQRLKEIRDSLDCLVEEGRKRTSKAAKSRPPPFDDSSSAHRRKAPRKGKKDV
jgi:hypothetical protein